MKSKFAKRATRKGKSNFNPNHDFINSAVGEYLSSGGKIEMIFINAEAYLDFMANKESAAPCDDFLLGG